jgi:mRNA interferase RelE/StbE
MYKIRILKEAANNLKNLDKTIVKRILRKLNWLSENAETIKPKGLREKLSAFAKLREGDYRIIYQILHDEKTIVVRFIGHRREIYKNK